MITSHPNGGYSLSRPDSVTPPDFAALAAALHETAHALSALTSHQPQDKAAAVPAELTEEPVSHRDGGETRALYFPQASVQMEKELLRKYRADDFQGLLEAAHILLLGLAKLMQSVNKDVRVRGSVIASLGAQLDHACALLVRMRHVYERVVPVHG